MAKAKLNGKVTEKYETPGFKPTPTTPVSDKGVSTATSGKNVPFEKVPNKAVKTRLRSNAVGSKVGSGVKPNTGTVTKKPMTAQANATVKKFTPSSSVAKLTKRNTAVTKPISTQKPVYETPGFKPAKKTSKK